MAEMIVEGVPIREIPDWPGYYAGTDGSVWSTKGRANRHRKTVVAPRRMKASLSNKGYMTVTFGHSKQNVHRLVLMAWRGRCPDGMMGCHNDDDRFNNSLANLRWGTHQSNIDDRGRNGHSLIGERHHKAKLTDYMAQKVRAAYDGQWCTVRAFAAALGVSTWCIDNIVNGRSFRHLLPSEAA